MAGTERATDPAPTTNRRLPRPGTIAQNVAVVVVLLLLASWLPPDTSLREVQQRGSLRVCVPVSYPPLVSGGDPDRPGIDIELVRELASRLALTVRFNENSAIGRDFNPRNWRVTRAQCEVLAGGVVASTTTRSFLETTDPHLETGWALVFLGEERALSGARVGFFAGASGLDRLALSGYLRAVGASVQVYSSLTELERALRNGEIDAAVTESLLARRLAEDVDGVATWVPGLPRQPLALGFWKGDLTLKRALGSALHQMRADGTLAAILERYELAPIAECTVC